MAKQRESKLSLKIRKTLKKQCGGWWVKIWGGPFQQSGIPDILGSVQGLFFAFETKRPDKTNDRGGRTSAIQDSTIEDIIVEGGAVAIVVTSPQEAVNAVRQRMAKTRRVPKTRS